MAKTKTEKAPAKPAKTPSTKGTKGARKAAAKAASASAAAARTPLARRTAQHGSKDDLAKKLAASLAVGDQDAGALADRLRIASNAQLLRLGEVVETVTRKYGGRDQLIAKLGQLTGKSKDKDYLAKLGTFPLPKLLDLARSAEKRA